MKKDGAGALIGGALLGPLGAAAGAAIQRRRNKKKAAPYFKSQLTISNNFNYRIRKCIIIVYFSFKNTAIVY